jgi:hypothetical protein
MVVRRAAACGLLLAVALLAPTVALAKVLDGRWGGDQAILTLSPDGGRLDAGCESLSIRAGLQADASGRFNAVASLEAYQPGPQRADEPLAAPQVRLTGQVSGAVMTLHVEASAGRPAHAYVLRRDAPAKVVRCL